MTKPAGFDPDAEHSPINVLTDWENQSKALARRGLKVGLNDLLMALDLPAGLQGELNVRLKHDGLPTLNYLSSEIEHIAAKALKRRKIKQPMNTTL